MWTERALERPFTRRLEIAADVEIPAVEVIAAGVKILISVLIGRGIGAMLLGMRAAAQHAGNGAAQQHATGHAHGSLCSAGQKSAAGTAPVIVVLRSAIPGTPPRRAARRLWFIAPEQAAEETA